jgi:hypothetical protein
MSGVTICRSLVCVFLLLFVIPVRGYAEKSTQPNIVLIISDDQGWTDFGFMGHPHIARRISISCRERVCCSGTPMSPRACVVHP